jgi:hypothetical protein
MGYCRTRRGFLELEVSPHADWCHFEAIADQISESLDATIVEKIDGLDARYWDFEISGRTVTLHLHAMAGIFGFDTGHEADSVVQQIAALLGISGAS